MTAQKIVRDKQGFSLIELLVVLAIMAVVLGFGIQGVQTLGSNQQVTQDAQNILSSLNKARSLALNGQAQSITDGWVYGYVYLYTVQGGPSYCVHEWETDPNVANPTISGTFPGTLTQIISSGTVLNLPAVSINCGSNNIAPLIDKGLYDNKSNVSVSFTDNGVSISKKYLVFENLTGNSYLYNADGTYYSPTKPVNMIITDGTNSKNIVLVDTNNDPPHF